MQQPRRCRPGKGFYQELFDSGTDSDFSDWSGENDEDGIIGYVSRVITCRHYCSYCIWFIVDLNYKECFGQLICEISLLCRTQTEDVTNKQSELYLFLLFHHRIRSGVGNFFKKWKSYTCENFIPRSILLPVQCNLHIIYI